MLKMIISLEHLIICKEKMLQFFYALLLCGKLQENRFYENQMIFTIPFKKEANNIAATFQVWVSAFFRLESIKINNMLINRLIGDK